MDTGAIIGSMAALIGIVIGLFQWILTANYKRQVEIGRQRDNQLDKLATEINEHEISVQKFKEEIYRDFPRREMITAITHEIRTDMSKLFNRLDKLSEQLNQMVGAIGRRKND